MKNIDLKLKCNKLEIDGWDCDYKKIGISLDGIDNKDLNTREVAECVELEQMFEAHGEDAIRTYIERNYDWFDKEEV